MEISGIEPLLFVCLKDSQGKEKAPKSEDFEAFGGDKRDRTADLLNAIQALSQLSYTPIFGSLSDSFCIIALPAKMSSTFFKNSRIFFG